MELTVLEKLSKNAKVTLGILLLFLGISCLLFTYFKTIKSNIFNEKNLKYFEEVDIAETIEEVVDETVPEETTTPVINYNYIGYLDIPKINLKRGFVSLNSKYNSISYNVMLIKGSSMPDVKNGNLILAAHRGNSSVSFFDKLYKLNLGDEANVTYNDKIYTYKLVNTYLEAKDGTIAIYRDENKTTLTLITCTRGDKKTQTVFIFELV
ncbi:sortase [bacterium]|nr:sortase [bacterium]MBD9114973.1 sortase [bacterium]